MPRLLFADVCTQGKELDLGYAARSKESIAANAAWLAKHSADACAWVRAQRKSG